MRLLQSNQHQPEITSADDCMSLFLPPLGEPEICLRDFLGLFYLRHPGEGSRSALDIIHDSIPRMVTAFSG
jgi:hypothetical protein